MAKTATIATLVANLEMNSASFRKEMDQARARTKNFSKDLKNTKAANDGFARSMRGAAQGVTAIDGPLGGVAGRLGAVNGLVTGGSLAWTGLGVAVAGATALIYKSIRAAEAMERQQLKIDALLKATSNASGRTAEELDEQARSVARNTLASVSGIRDAQGVLLTFKSVQTDVFDQAIVLSQDLAAVMGGDAKSAALQLGKALEDPATGLTALKRSGVSFTETEKEQIKTMQESGRVAEAQRFILAKLAQQVGGAGSGEAGGLAGQVDTLSQNWEEFLEAMGRTEEASKSVGLVANAISWWREALMPTEAEETNERYIELQEKYRWHQKQLAKAQEEGVQAQIEIQGNLVEKYRAQLQEIKDADLEAAVAQREERRKAADSAAAAREQMERDRAAAELKLQQESGAAQLIQLDQFLADKDGKLKLDHQEKLRQIEALQLSEQELTRRGFESLEALKAEYKAREDERYQSALAQETARREEKRLREQAALAEDQLQREIAHMKQIAAEEALAARLTAIQEQQAQMRRQTEAGLNQFVLFGAQNLTGQMTELAKKGAGEQSAIYKALFLTQKALAVAQTIVSTETAAAAALAPPPVGLGPVAGVPYSMVIRGLGYASAGIIAGTAIAGIAHGGMDYVPAESTYLLDKGERVLSPNQNADLTAALKNGGMGARVTVNLVEDGSRGGQIEQEKGLNGEDVIRIFVADIRNGGDSAAALETTYGMSRTGTI